jgi:hypothetical protein
MADQDQTNQGAGGGPPPEQATVVYASQLSPELRQDKSIMEALKDSPKLNDLAKNHAALKARMQRSIIIPNAEKPDPEELKAFRAAMGLPEKADGYEFNTQGFKEVEGVDQVVAMCRAKAAEMGLTKAQGQKLFDAIMGLSKSGRDSVNASRKEMVDTFETRLAAALGNDPEKAKAAQNLHKSFLLNRIAAIADKIKPGEGERIIKTLAANGMLYDTTFTQVNAELAQLLGEEPFADGNGAGPTREAKKGQQNYSPEFEATHGKRSKR